MCGIVGYVGGRAAITLDLQMYVGARDERDDVWIEGQPALHVRQEAVVDEVEHGLRGGGRGQREEAEEGSLHRGDRSKAV